MGRLLGRKRSALIVPGLFLIVFGVLQASRASAVPVSVADAHAVVAQFERTDPGLRRFFNDSAGYAVFPNIGKGAFIVGAASGDGILFQRGEPVGKVAMTQVTAGAQVGGQSYSEVVFFQDDRALAKFKLDEMTFAAQTSAVGLQSGVSANAKYSSGVAIITATKGGLMLEASVGGQKFHYTPFPRQPQG